MKPLLTVLIVWAVLCVTVYLMGSFGSATFNIAFWSEKVRSMCVFGMLMSLILALCSLLLVE